MSRNPADGSVWCSGNGRNQRQLLRLELGDNPPESRTAKLSEPPASAMNPGACGSGGLHLTTEGVAWQDWRGSGHFAGFDRSRCEDISGPHYAAWHLEGGPGRTRR